MNNSIIDQPIDMNKWRETLHVKGRIATQKEVDTGMAAFVLAKAKPEPENIDIPSCAILKDDESGNNIPIIIIQAERTPEMVVIGYRRLDGLPGVCSLEEVQILKEPDDRFYEKH